MFKRLTYKLIEMEFKIDKKIMNLKTTTLFCKNCGKIFQFGMKLTIESTTGIVLDKFPA